MSHLDLSSPAMCVVGQAEIPIPAQVMEDFSLCHEQDADFGVKLVALMKMSNTRLKDENFGTEHGFETANLENGQDIDIYYVALAEEWRQALKYLQAIPPSMIVTA